MKDLKIVIALQAILVVNLLWVIETKAQVQTPHYVSIITNSKAYYDYLPQGYNSESQNYPLLIFVHGIGELGWGTPLSLPNVLLNGPPRIIKDGRFPNTFTVNGQTFKFIVLSPQFISWPTPTDIEELIDFAVGHYRVDVNRIYLTGLSMGGGVVWEYASKKAEYANSLAALVPVCGVAPSNAEKGRIIASSNLPVWATHNDGDQTVEVKNTHEFIHYINSSVPPPTPLAKKTIFDNDSHDAWSVTYNPNFKENGLNVYEWMLQYKRGGTAPPSNQAPSANAGPDVVITLPSNSTVLYGSGADADGTVTKYNWSKLAGPSSFSISNSAVASPTVSNLTEGEYTFRLTVTDDDNVSAWDDVSVKVNPAPTATSLVVPGIVQAENYFAMSGVQIENTNDAGGGMNVTSINSGDWMDYRLNVTTAGSYSINFRVATANNNQSFQLRKSDGTVLTQVNVPRTGSNQVYTLVGAVLSLQTGVQTLRIHSLQSGWTFNWAEFTPVTSVLALPGKLQAEDYKAMNGVRTENTSDADGGANVGWIDNGDWMDYDVNVAYNGIYSVSFRVATPYSGQRFQLRKSNGTVLATINVPQTGGNQTWATLSIPVTLEAGLQTLRIHSLQSGWNINWIEFVVAPAYAPVPGTIEAAKFSTMRGIQIESCYDEKGGWNIGWVDNGDWLDYLINPAKAGTYTVNFRVATPYLNQKFQIRNSNGVVLANVNVPQTGGDQIWTTVSASVSLPKGNQTIRIHSTQSGWNIVRAEFIDESALDLLSVSDRTSIANENALEGNSSVLMFPNPVSDRVMLAISNGFTGDLNIQVINEAGVAVKTFRYNKNLPISKINLPINELPAGTYIITIKMKSWSDIRKMVKL